MPTAAQIEIVKRTIPVLRQHGETLTRHFYARLFEHAPDVRRYFNPAHQRSGGQQRALAGAILAYAQHIDDPAALSDAIEVIAQKHASLTIQPEHYPIVGEHLLASIREVLGDAATADVLDAWAAAYDELAGVFIERERTIYAEQRAHQGWAGFKPFTIVQRERESDNTVSLYLVPADGSEPPAHLPGQYVSIRVQDADGHTAMRNYSLSNAPGAAAYRISVKREVGDGEVPGGDVSNRIHDGLDQGDRLELSPPCGAFTLELPEPDDRPLVFIAGGIGITPLISMAHAALQASPSRRVIFIQAVRHGGLRPFTCELETLAGRYPSFSLHVCFTQPRETDGVGDPRAKRGELEPADLQRWIGGWEATYYFCGPLPMMSRVDRMLETHGVAIDDRRYECFGPAQPLAARADDEGTLEMHHEPTLA
ncbi:NO-inducible flavohemoprotein [Salinicola acroporae]|uniref:nitric oxide dioxygenase n=1 Tax=Salinicola acroporae TaxID=1541440 RepID=A0ABT6I4A3_9GAMM|nr:NO-inducible flavohemoprotein [Salinicola acroporae]MDH4572500.1 NO-inducible flavohemoprotein [Salinicola acroporae]